jgi:tetratricopeptide (TPR) repeat protein
MLEAARAVAVRGARIRPIVFVFEDLHWIDTSTEEYLATLMDSVASVPIMVLLTYRVGYAPPFGSRSFYTTLTLHSLSEAETMAMAGRVLGTEQFPPELKAALMDKAEGVPLFVEEVTKTLLDLGILRREGERYRMVRQTAEVNVPDTIQAIIMARLDRLGEGGKRTVQLASVIGRQFLRRLLERIAELPGQLEGLLRELKALEIIYEQGLLPEPAYIFKHAVIQDVAYNSLLRDRRRELHRSVGYAIEELYSDRLADHYEELAYHFAHGEEWPKAMEYGAIAGARASERFATAEAAKHYAGALHSASMMTPPPTPETRAGLHVKHAAALALLADYEAAVREYETASELARQVGNRKLEAEVLMGLALAYSFYHKTEPALRAVDQALAIARDIGDRSAQASCLVTRAEAIGSGYGQIIEAATDIEEAIRLSETLTNPLLRARVLVFTGRVVQWQGEFDRAIAVLGEGIELARREHSGFLFGLGLFTLGHAHLAKGEYEEALHRYHELRSYAEGAGDKLYVVRAPNCIAGVHLELYDLDEAIRLNEEGDDVSKRLWRWPEPRGHSLVKLGLSHLCRGDHARARDAFEQAWRLLDEDPWARWRWQIPLLAARGELALAEHRLDEAWSFAGESLDLATRTDARKHMARAQGLQGRVLDAQGRLDEAARVLRASIRLAETVKTPREAWMGRAALGRVSYQMGSDKDAEALFTEAARTIETIAGGLTTLSLRSGFLGAPPVAEVYRMIGRRPPGV